MRKYLYFTFLFLLISIIGIYYFIFTDSGSEAEFRTMQDPLSTSCDLRGLRSLQASGGPTPYFKQLKAQLSALKQPVIVIDGQREDHGYIEEIPTVYFGYERKADIRHYIRRWIYTRTFGWRKDLVRPEQEIAQSYGFGYRNIHIDSKVRTPDIGVDEFVKFVDQLPSHTWLHFHCRLGKGRTSLMLVMFDIMHNAPTVAFEDIVRRQHLLGSENLLDTVARHHGTYLSSTLERRKRFMQNFYTFICDRKRGGPRLWSEWRALRVREGNYIP